jgi:hypothetical protein
MRWPIDSNGRVLTVLNTGSASANSSWVGGFAMNSSGRLQLDTAVVAGTDSFSGGIRRKSSGVLRVATSGGASRVGGLLVTATGVLVVEASGTPVNHVAGLPVNASGAVCVSTVT